MARNTQVAADHNAPPITDILARHVADHPSRGWSDEVDHEAHRTFMNWLGCAVGAARHDQTGIGIEQLEARVEAMPLGRLPRAAHAPRITLAGTDAGDEHVPTIAGAVLAMLEHDRLGRLGGRGLGVQQQLGRARVLAVDREVHAAVATGGAERPGHTRAEWTRLDRQRPSVSPQALYASHARGDTTLAALGSSGLRAFDEDCLR